MSKLILLLVLIGYISLCQARTNYHQILYSSLRVKTKPALIFVQYNDIFFVTENTLGTNEQNIEIKSIGDHTMGGLTETAFNPLIDGKLMKGYMYLLTQGVSNNKIDVYVKSETGSAEVQKDQFVRSYNLVEVK